MFTCENEHYIWHFKVVANAIDIQVSGKTGWYQASQWHIISNGKIGWLPAAHTMLRLTPEVKSHIERLVKMRAFL